MLDAGWGSDNLVGLTRMGNYSHDWLVARHAFGRCVHATCVTTLSFMLRSFDHRASWSLLMLWYLSTRSRSGLWLSFLDGPYCMLYGSVRSRRWRVLAQAACSLRRGLHALGFCC